jgi:hypothetical protein
MYIIRLKLISLIMKYTSIIIFILTLPFFMAAQPSSAIDWDEVTDRYIEKYQPVEVPQWIFPIIFENGLNERDTIYFGYDPDADLSNYYDTLYGEKCYPMDSSSFQVFWNECTLNDSTLAGKDVFIEKNPYVNLSIRMRYGYYPVTMYYNSELLNSDSLMPYINNTPAPNIQGEVWLAEDHSRMGDWDHNNDEWNFILPWLWPCVITDSVSWSDHPFSDSLDIAAKVGSSATGITNMTLSFRDWNNGEYTDIKELSDNSGIMIFPNPAKNKLTIKIEAENNDNHNWKLIDISGKMISTGTLQSDTNQIDILGIENGFYFLQIYSGNEVFIKKVIISR